MIMDKMVVVGGGRRTYRFGIEVDCIAVPSALERLVALFFQFLCFGGYCSGIGRRLGLRLRLCSRLGTRICRGG